MNAYERLLRLGEQTVRLTHTLLSLPLPEPSVYLQADDPVLRLSALLESLGVADNGADEPEVRESTLDYPAVNRPDESLHQPPESGSYVHGLPAASKKRDGRLRVEGQKRVVPVLAHRASEKPDALTPRPLNPDVPSARREGLPLTAPLPLVGDGYAQPETMRFDSRASESRFADTSVSPSQNQRPADKLPPTLHPESRAAPLVQGMRLTRGTSRLETLLRANLTSQIRGSESGYPPSMPPTFTEPPAVETAARHVVEKPPTFQHEGAWTIVPEVGNEPTLVDKKPDVEVNANGDSPPVTAHAKAGTQSAVDIQNLLDQLADQLEFDLIRTYGTSRKP